jgi:hypothetical protein
MNDGIITEKMYLAQNMEIFSKTVVVIKTKRLKSTGHVAHVRHYKVCTYFWYKSDVCLPFYLDLKAQPVINKCRAATAARPKKHQFVSTGQTQVLRFYYYEYYNKSQLTAASIHELFSSQQKSPVTYLQTRLFLFILCTRQFSIKQFVSCTMLELT